jgi:outer membrane murein-binding lipoprotein Lpp
MSKSRHSLVVIIDNGGEIVTRVVDCDRVTIGRSIEAMVPIPNPNVSRIHLIVTFSGRRILIQDNESSNGTYVRSERILAKKNIEVEEFEKISIGNSNITIQFLVAEKSSDKQKSLGIKFGFGSAEEKEAQKIIEEAQDEANRIIQHGQMLASAHEQLHKQKIDEELLELDRKKDQILSQAKMEAKRYLQLAETQARDLFDTKKEELKNYYHAKLAEIQDQVESEKKRLLIEAEKERERLLENAKLESSRAQAISSELIKQAEEKANQILQSANETINQKVTEYILEAEKKNEKDRQQYWIDLQNKFQLEYKDQIENFERLKVSHSTTLVELQNEVKLLSEKRSELLLELEKIEEQKNSLKHNHEKLSAQVEAQNIILKKQESDIKLNADRLNDLMKELEKVDADYKKVDKLLEDRRLEIERSLELLEKHHLSVEAANREKIMALDELSQVQKKLDSVKLDYIEKSREIEEKIDQEKKILTRELDLFREKSQREKELISEQIRIEIKDLSEQKCQLVEKVKALKNELDMEDEKLERSRLQFETQKQEKEQLELDLVLSSKALNESNQNIEKLKQVLEELSCKKREIENEVEIKSSELSVTKAQMEEKATALKSLVERIAVLEQKENQLANSIQELEAKETTVKSETKSIREQKEQLELDLDFSSKALNELNQNIEKLKQVLEELSCKKREIENEVEIKSSELSVTKAQMEEKAPALKSLVERIALLEQKENQLTNSIQELQAKETTLKSETKSIREQFELFQNQISQKKSELDNLISQYNLGSAELKEKLQKEFEAKEQALKKSLEAREHSELMRINKLVQEKFAEFDSQLESMAKALHYQIDSLLVSKFEPHIFKELSEKIKVTIEATLTEKSAGASIEQLNEKVKNLKVGRFYTARFTYLTVVASLILGLSVFPLLKLIDQKVNGATYKEQLDAKIQLQKLEYEARRFRPPQVDEWHESYVDLVIYTENFVSLYHDEKYVSNMNRELLNYMFSTYRVEEEKTIQASAKVLSLVKELDKKFQNIHPDFVEENLEQMRKMESETLTEIETILGSKVRVEAFFKAQKRIFENTKKAIRMAN